MMAPAALRRGPIANWDLIPTARTDQPRRAEPVDERVRIPRCAGSAPLSAPISSSNSCPYHQERPDGGSPQARQGHGTTAWPASPERSIPDSRIVSPSNDTQNSTRQPDMSLGAGAEDPQQQEPQPLIPMSSPPPPPSASAQQQAQKAPQQGYGLFPTTVTPTSESSPRVANLRPAPDHRSTPSQQIASFPNHPSTSYYPRKASLPTSVRDRKDSFNSFHSRPSFQQRKRIPVRIISNTSSSGTTNTTWTSPASIVLDNDSISDNTSFFRWSEDTITSPIGAASGFTPPGPPPAPIFPSKTRSRNPSSSFPHYHSSSLFSHHSQTLSSVLYPSSRARSVSSGQYYPACFFEADEELAPVGKKFPWQGSRSRAGSYGLHVQGGKKGGGITGHRTGKGDGSEASSFWRKLERKFEGCCGGRRR